MIEIKGNLKKRVFTFFCSLVVCASFLFIECSVYFPDSISIFDGESVSVRKGSPYSIDISASKTVEVNGEYDALVKLFGVIPVKNVEISVLPTTKIVPGGKTAGIKLFTKGLMCVGTEEIKGKDGKRVNAEDIGLKNADMILKANNIELSTVEQFAGIVSGSDGNAILLTVETDGKTWEKEISPVNTKDGYKLGIWVRDSTAGIGTITFSDPLTHTYGALGHPITDVDTGAIMPIKNGSISGTKIVSVKKGKAGAPGELNGVFDPVGEEKGVIIKNTRQGIYGILNDALETQETETPLPVASNSQVKTGKAEIYSNVDGEKVEKFEVEIIKIMRHAVDDKNMIIKVTDERLLEKTGGIVQGMSGSPIIQNGKIIGAVTHVFINDPTKGYGIFIEKMLAEAENVG